MFEKVNPCHPDKVADRIAGAMVDLAYQREENPRVAVEVLIGHGHAYIIAESSVEFTHDDVEPIVERIAGKGIHTIRLLSIPQDKHLAENQSEEIRCGDNGIFKGVPVSEEEETLTEIATSIYEKFPTDGKYIIERYQPIKDNYENQEKWPVEIVISTAANMSRMHKEMKEHIRRFTICQSHASENDKDIINGIIDDCLDDGLSMISEINPLGEWTGGCDVDSGATNRKLGSDMGRGVTGGGLHGKDLSKADVSVNIMCHILSQKIGKSVTASCSIGDSFVLFDTGGLYSEKYKYSEIVETAREYIKECGGFEKFAEWGLIRMNKND